MRDTTYLLNTTVSSLAEIHCKVAVEIIAKMQQKALVSPVSLSNITVTYADIFQPCRPYFVLKLRQSLSIKDREWPLRTDASSQIVSESPFLWCSLRVLICSKAKKDSVSPSQSLKFSI